MTLESISYNLEAKRTLFVEEIDYQNGFEGHIIGEVHYILNFQDLLDLTQKFKDDKIFRYPAEIAEIKDEDLPRLYRLVSYSHKKERAVVQKIKDKGLTRRVLKELARRKEL